MSAPTPAAETFGAEATRLITSGYSSILGAFQSAKDRGIFPKGEVLPHKIHSSEWTVPALLDTEELQKFMELTGMHTPAQVLGALWYILENVCEETRLVPEITIGRMTGEIYARLTL